jgi:DNA polymerase elongation subunit (family B)
MLTVFKQARTAEEFRALIPTSVEVLRRSAAALRDGVVDHKDLVLTTTVSKDIVNYKVNTLPKSALLQLRDLGVQVEPGQSVHYIVTDEYSQNYKRRVCLAEKMRGIDKGDPKYLREIGGFSIGGNDSNKYA